MKNILVALLSFALVISMNAVTLAQEDEEDVPQPRNPETRMLDVRDSGAGTVSIGTSRVKLLAQLATEKFDFGVAGKLTKGSAIVLMDQNQPAHAVCMGSDGLAEIAFRGNGTVQLNRSSSTNKILFRLDAKIGGRIERMGKSNLDLLVGLRGTDGRMLKIDKAQYLGGRNVIITSVRDNYLSIPYRQAGQVNNLEILMNSGDLPADGKVEVVFKLQAATHGRDAMVIMYNMHLSDLNVRVLQAEEL